MKKPEPGPLDPVTKELLCAMVEKLSRNTDRLCEIQAANLARLEALLRALKGANS